MSSKHDSQPETSFDGITEKHGQRPPVYFMVLFFGLIVWGVIFIAYYLLSGWSSQQEFKEKMTVHQQLVTDSAPKPAVATAAADPKPAAAPLFAEHCAVCHGAAGKGGIGPDLTAASFKYGRTAAEIVVSISGGRPGGMPAFGTQLSRVQIDALAEFTLSLK